jgi:hypothetical protein
MEHRPDPDDENEEPQESPIPPDAPVETPQADPRTPGAPDPEGAGSDPVHPDTTPDTTEDQIQEAFE